MVESVKFDGKDGYISKKIAEPTCGVRYYGKEFRRYRRTPFTDEEKAEIKRYQKEMRWWKKHKDDLKNPKLYANLVDREFKFTNGLNIIFGPNASGKTTLLKAIAGNAGASDGFSGLREPFDIKFELGKKIDSDDVRGYLNKMMQNTAEIKWDGAPIYYHNFESKLQNSGYIGSLGGSVLGDDLGDEIMYIMNRNNISMGQNSIFLLNRLYQIGQTPTCYGKLFSKYVSDGKVDIANLKKTMNDAWSNAYEEQLKYYLSFEKSLIDSPITFLFDEIDKSMDILNVYYLYTEYLPKLIKETGVQVILVSHSPVVLSKKVRENPLVNFISIDDKYTEKCLEIF